MFDMKTPVYNCFVTGVQCCDYDPATLDIKAGDPLRLKWDPENIYDHNAVQVHTITTPSTFLGFVPRHITDKLAEERKKGWIHSATLNHFNISEPYWMMFSIRIVTLKQT